MCPTNGRTSFKSTPSILRSSRLELLDRPIDSVAELEENLADLERANHFLGGVRMVQRALRAFSARTIVDVGCGAADIPLALVRDARAHARDLKITCVDSSPQVLAFARRHSDDPALTFVQAEAMDLPLPDRSFDIAMCNLTLHHCDPPAAAALLKEMRRIARQGCIVTDLRRSRIVWLGAKILAAIATHNRLSRHDAPLSVLRAYTPREAMALARAAGWRAPRFGRAPIGRMVLIDA